MWDMHEWRQMGGIGLWPSLWSILAAYRQLVCVTQPNVCHTFPLESVSRQPTLCHTGQALGDPYLYIYGRSHFAGQWSHMSMPITQSLDDGSCL